MSEYTPGPWATHKKNGRVVVAGETKIATAATTSDPPDAWANARLIAAAPEMLRLIRDLYAGLQLGQGRFASSDDGELAEAIDDEMSNLLGGVDWQGKREQ